MLWPRTKFLSIPGLLKGLVTSGLPSSKAEVSDYGATTVADHFSLSGAFSLAMTALECTEGRSVVELGAVPQLHATDSWKTTGGRKVVKIFPWREMFEYLPQARVSGGHRA